MSKNKHYHNYNNYSNNTAKPVEPVEESVETTPVTEEIEQVEVTEVAAEAEPVVVEPEVEETTPEPAPEPTPLIGIVNCGILRVRSAADSTADNVICEITEGSEVQINETESTPEFYKVTTSAGAEGFCMKKFITIK